MFPTLFLRQLNCGVLSVSCFTFLAKEKLSFFLIYSFCCCLVKGGRALKVVKQLAMRGLVVYKLVAYKKTKCS